MSAEVMRRLLLVLLLAGASVGAGQSSGSASKLPALPVVALDQFPEASRAALRPAFERANGAPDDEVSVAQLAMTLHAWEQWEPAHAAYQRAIGLSLSRDGQHAWKWKYLDAVVLQRLARPNDAANALRSAAPIVGGTPTAGAAGAGGAGIIGYLPAKVKLAEALFDSGDVEESAQLYGELVKEPSAEPIAEFGLGRVAAAAGRHEEAARHFVRAIALFPEFGAAHYALARSARALGKTEESQRALERHQQYGARWPALDDPLLAEIAAIRTDARASLQRGVKLAEAGDIPGAIAAHEAALAALSKSAVAESAAPRSAGPESARSESARPDSARSDSARSDSGRPDSSRQASASPYALSAAQAHVELITLYGRQKNWAKAEEHYRSAIALGADLEAAHYNYGVLLGLQDRRTEAAAAYRLALDVNPLNPQARNNLGQLLERDRKYHDAAAEYRRVVEVMPTFRLARFNLGRMLIVLGHPRDAVVQLEHLTEPRDAETPRYLFALATAKIHAGQRDDGVKWANEAKRLAVEHGQQELAVAIERDLAALSGGR